jgi:hypothetical protein
VRARPDVMLLVHELLQEQHRGAARAATWAALLAKVSERLGENVAVWRLQEAAAALVDQGDPIVATSDDGVWWAETVEEVDRGIRELEHRTAGVGRRKSRLKAVRRRMVSGPQLELLRGGAR